MQADAALLRQDHAALNNMLKLANITGPRIVLEGGDIVDGEAAGVAAAIEFGAGLCEKMFGEFGDVFTPLAQGR